MKKSELHEKYHQLGSHIWRNAPSMNYEHMKALTFFYKLGLL